MASKKNQEKKEPQFAEQTTNWVPEMPEQQQATPTQNENFDVDVTPAQTITNVSDSEQTVKAPEPELAFLWVYKEQIWTKWQLVTLLMTEREAKEYFRGKATFKKADLQNGVRP